MTNKLLSFLEAAVNRLWYPVGGRLSWYHLILYPFSSIFSSIVYCRRLLYRYKILPQVFFNKPIMIIGNITVGGVGKTPIVQSIYQLLKSQGYTPGIVSRGYGGRCVTTQAYRIKKNDKASDWGDEPVMLVNSLDCLLAVGKSKINSVNYLLKNHPEIDIILSDDGLQHYRLARDLEIAVVDSDRGYGNRLSLPAGPLREPVERLNSVDIELIIHKLRKNLSSDLIYNNNLNKNLNKNNYHIYFTLGDLVPKKSWIDLTCVHAVTAIGNPDAFFDMLREKGLTVIPHAFPDHYIYQPKDLAFSDAYPVLITEKDAVKLKEIGLNNIKNAVFVVPLVAKLSDDCAQKILTLVGNIKKIGVI